MAEHVTLRWAKESADALRALPREISGRNGGPLRGALFAAGRVLKDEVVKNAPIGKGTPSPGNLRKQILLYRDRNPAALGMSEHYILTVRTGRKGLRRLKLGASLRALTGNDAWYWFWVEFGTSRQPAQSFMRRGFETKKHDALDTFRRELQRGISAAVARARRKSGVP
jgi:HK97 gp10 family phage protein